MHLSSVLLSVAALLIKEATACPNDAVYDRCKEDLATFKTTTCDTLAGQIVDNADMQQECTCIYYYHLNVLCTPQCTDDPVNADEQEGWLASQESECQKANVTEVTKVINTARWDKYIPQLPAATTTGAAAATNTGTKKGSTGSAGESVVAQAGLLGSLLSALLFV